MNYTKIFAKKKIAALILCFIFCLGLLAACANGGHTAQSIEPPAFVPSAQSSQSAASIPQNTPLRIMLPDGHTQLADIVRQFAYDDGIDIEIIRGRQSVGYAGEVQNALENENAPDLVWLNNFAEFAEIDGNNYFAQFNAQSTEPTLQTIAGGVPQRMRINGEEGVYSLPAGYVAQGYLVNIDMLAALLNESNRQNLLNNLVMCSFEQWKMLIISLEEYLKNPGRIEITLAATKYITPGQRPNIARGLRGMFALPDADGYELLDGILTSALCAPFSNELAAISASDEELTDKIYPLLGSLMRALEFETKHLTRAEGALTRGSEYAETWDKLSFNDALGLFSSGTALAIRANSQTALLLGQEIPTLRDKLALIPIKLPLMPREDDDPAASQEAMQALAYHNNRLWVASAGAFYMNKNTENKNAITAFLLRVFTGRESTEAFENLGIVPFAPYTAQESLLETQILNAVQGQSGALLPVQPASWLRAQTVIGEYVRDELLDKDEWLADEVDGFFTIAQVALSLRVTAQEGSE